jgi:pimeloyl-ACP methyl ester carboxylesterase
MAALAAPGVGELLTERNDFELVDRAWGYGGTGARPPPELIREIKDTLARSMPAPIRYYRAAFWPPQHAGDRLRRIGHPRRRIRVPTLNVVGDHDVIAPEMGEGQERFFSGPFRREVLAGTGHFLQVERPVEVARWLLTWASEHGHAPDRRR